MKNIVLIGFMGTGKTSVGRLLAGRLGCAFHDLDRKIEERCGMSIPAMFREHGESYFRAREKEAVLPPHGVGSSSQRAAERSRMLGTLRSCAKTVSLSR